MTGTKVPNASSATEWRSGEFSVKEDATKYYLAPKKCKSVSGDDYIFGLLSEINIQAENTFNSRALSKHLPELVTCLDTIKYKKNKVSVYVRMKTLKLDSVFSEFLRTTLSKDFTFKLVKIEKYNMHGFAEVTISVLE